MVTITLDQIIDLAHQLPRAQRAELIARLARDLALEPTHTQAAASADVPAMTVSQAHTTLAELRAGYSTLPRPRLTLGEQLEQDRAERQASIEGQPYVHA